jgi:hypothetical protein
MEIVEQKLITSICDIGHINIIDFNRCNGLWENNFVTALEVIGNWLIGNTVYTVIREDMRKYPDRNDFPRWGHVGNHRSLGKRYWNMFHALFQGTLTFHDMPDFSGTIIFDDPKQEVAFWGDLWISLVSEGTHIVLEFIEDVGLLILEHVAKRLGL